MGNIIKTGMTAAAPPRKAEEQYFGYKDSMTKSNAYRELSEGADRWYIYKYESKTNYRTTDVKTVRYKKYIDASRVVKVKYTFEDLWSSGVGNLKTSGEKQETIGDRPVMPSLCEGGKLRFVSVEQAKAFFKGILHQICYGKTKDYAAAVMVSFNDLFYNRFWHPRADRLELDLNNFVPDPVMGKDDDGNDIVKNEADIMVAMYIHREATKGYLASLNQYARNYAVRNELDEIKNLSPKEQRRVFGLYKKHASPEQYAMFKGRALKQDIKMGTCDSLYAGFAALPLVGALRPAACLGDIKNHVADVSPPITERKAFNEFMAKYRDKMKEPNPKLLVYQLPESKEGRLLLVENNPKSWALYQKAALKYQLASTTENWFNYENIESVNTVAKMFEQFDQVAVTMLAGLNVGKEMRLFLFGVYGFIVGIRTMVDFALNPVSWVSFLATIQTFPGMIWDIGKVFMHGTEEEAAMVLCSLVSLFKFGEPAGHLATATIRKRWMPIKARMIEFEKNLHPKMRGLYNQLKSPKGRNKIQQMRQALDVMENKEAKKSSTAAKSGKSAQAAQKPVAEQRQKEPLEMIHRRRATKSKLRRRGSKFLPKKQ